MTLAWASDNPAHREIRQKSPIQPTGLAGDGQTDLLIRGDLERYLFQLNRHPGRNVAAALSATDEGGIALDYRVAESKPWYVYFQSSDTGSERTATWQNRFGYVNTQLRGNDDVAQLQYTNAGGNDLHSIQASYEAPWFDKRRPQWWTSSGREPWWLDWINRDKLPWWGSDRMRWRIGGSWTSFEAEGIVQGGLGASTVSNGSEWNISNEFLYTLFQHRALFIDFILGVRARGITTQLLGNTTPASAIFLLPQVGLRIERLTETGGLDILAIYERSVLEVPDNQLQNLGRIDVDDDYSVLRWGVTLTQYLEPLLNGSAWRDPTTPWSSTLAHEIAFFFRGQYALDARLIPQASQVVGGLFSVRGYPQSAAVGDTVTIGSAEYRFHIPRSLPVSGQPLKLPRVGRFRVAPQQVYGRPDWDLILRTFFDAAYAIRNPSPLAPLESNETLLSAGVGLELRIRHNLNIRVDWARALTSTSSGASQPVSRGNDEFHFLFSLVY